MRVLVHLCVCVCLVCVFKFANYLSVGFPQINNDSLRERECVCVCALYVCLSLPTIFQFSFPQINTDSLIPVYPCLIVCSISCTIFPYFIDNKQSHNIF